MRIHILYEWNWSTEFRVPEKTIVTPLLLLLLNLADLLQEEHIRKFRHHVTLKNHLAQKREQNSGPILKI